MMRRRNLAGLALPLALPAAISAACGARSLLPTEGPADGGGGSDAGSDAPADVVVIDAPIDSPADSGVKPGLGAACDGLGSNPSFCESGLACYQGTDPSDEPDRWPGGYCTKDCYDDSDCKAFGGVCVGEYTGTGRCLLACDEPKDCRQGYACRPADFFDPAKSCAPSGFIATRGPGEACFQATDPNAPHYAPKLPLSHFSASQQVDQGFFAANEIALAVSTDDSLVAGANAIQASGYDNPAWFASAASFPLTVGQSAGPKDGSQYYSDPYLVAGKDGSFYYSTLGLDMNLDSRVLVARSTDHGKSWTTVKANPDSDCSGKLGEENGPCMDHPWLAIGPDRLDPSKEAVYAAYLAVRPDDYPTVLIRSVDGGKTWGIPDAPNQSLAVFSPKTDGLVTNLITPVVDGEGIVHMVATGIVDETKGSVQNSIQYTRSLDGGKTRLPPVRINPVGESVPYEQAAMVVGTKEIFVAYVRGAPDGDWDIMLARSSDGASFSYEQVNDELGGCSTNFHPAIAIDQSTQKVYVAWYDGRFAPYEGAVAISVCDPAASGKACGPNEAVSDQPFFITTDRYDFTFIGDYFALAARPGGTVWAGFGDTRIDGISHAFVARGSFP